MRPDREMAIAALQSLGWQATRTKPSRHVIWEFRRADTGGLWDVVKCKQENLCMGFVAEIAMQFDDAHDLVREIKEAKERWLKFRFFGIYHRAASEQEAL